MYLLQAKKRMARLIQRIIQEKRRKILDGDGQRDPQRDAIDVLISGGSHELTDELISDNMIDLMIPAEDSVPVLITLAIKYLSECPLALQQLEVSSVCANLCLALHYIISFWRVFRHNIQMYGNRELAKLYR
jgi:cytochrome P450